jgi:hypothetical protein
MLLIVSLTILPFYSPSPFSNEENNFVENNKEWFLNRLITTKEMLSWQSLIDFIDRPASRTSFIRSLKNFSFSGRFSREF